MTQFFLIVKKLASFFLPGIFSSRLFVYLQNAGTSHGISSVDEIDIFFGRGNFDVKAERCCIHFIPECLKQRRKSHL